MKRLNYLGHAGFLLEFNKVFFLIDPWLSKNPAFLNTWYKWPDNSFIIAEDRFDFQKVNYIWCSHEHTDHFDPAFLSQLKKVQK